MGIPEPFLTLMPNILTTKETYRAASLPGVNAWEVEGELRYQTYLTYMYERDLSEAKYWDTLIATSTLQGLQMNAKLVSTLLTASCNLWKTVLVMSIL